MWARVHHFLFYNAFNIFLNFIRAFFSFGRMKGHFFFAMWTFSHFPISLFEYEFVVQAIILPEKPTNF